ncbi:MAG: hypothetical protein AAF567_20010 [Actinomycetota bacterium]
MDTHHPDRISDPTYGGYDPHTDPESDEFWDAFDEAEEWAANRPRPWYRRLASIFAVFAVAGMLATGALIPWGELFDRLDNISEPVEIEALADETVAESPYGWLVEDIRVRDIIPGGVAGFVHSAPADGIITVDVIGWEPEELRSTVAHEIGHLLDFAAYGDSIERRDGLESEVWAECAAVDAGFRRTDPDGADQVYRCTNTELEQYRFSVSLLGEVCAPWNGICRNVTPIGG